MPNHPAIEAGRAAVITGGASGIGLAAAKRFAGFPRVRRVAVVGERALDDPG